MLKGLVPIRDIFLFHEIYIFTTHIYIKMTSAKFTSALFDNFYVLFCRFSSFSAYVFVDRFQIDSQGILRTASSNLPQNTLYNFKVKAKETGNNIINII